MDMRKRKKTTTTTTVQYTHRFSISRTSIRCTQNTYTKKILGQWRPKCPKSNELAAYYLHQ